MPFCVVLLLIKGEQLHTVTDGDIDLLLPTKSILKNFPHSLSVLLVYILIFCQHIEYRYEYVVFSIRARCEIVGSK